jgi:hypothetical protein
VTRRAALAMNAAAALVTLVFSAVVLVGPGIGLPAGVDVTAGAAFYGRACALRSIALAAVLLVVIARTRALPVPLLVVAGLTQLADAALHMAYGAPALAMCALVLAAVPFGSLRAVRGIKEDGRALTWEHDFHDD